MDLQGRVAESGRAICKGRGEQQATDLQAASAGGGQRICKKAGGTWGGVERSFGWWLLRSRWGLVRSSGWGDAVRGGSVLRGALVRLGLAPVRLRAREKDPLSPVTRAVLALIQALLSAMTDRR